MLPRALGASTGRAVPAAGADRLAARERAHAADTDWRSIATLYAHLLEDAPSPVVALNHAVAVAMADGPRAGLALLDASRALDGYHLFHAPAVSCSRGRRGRRRPHRAGAGDRARAPSDAERRHLERRIAALA